MTPLIIASHLATAFLLYTGTLLVGLVTAPLLRDYTLARLVAPIALVLAFFFVEHLVGLGELSLAGALLFIGLLALVLRRRSLTLLSRHWVVEAACLAGFLYCFLWRWAFPDINGNTERLWDLSFVCNYLRGERLPPLDTWFPPERFNFYYSFQHYAAALVGRFMDLEPGVASHLTFCLLVSLTMGAAAYGVIRLCPRPLHRLLVLASFLIGGTGATLVVPFMSTVVPRLHAPMRFMGNYAASPEQPTRFGTWLAGLAKHQGPEGPDLPIELFSYDVYLGDFHPHLSGFLLLTVALACMAAIDRGPRGRGPSRAVLYGFLFSTVPLTLVSNAWAVPLSALLIAAWSWVPLRRQGHGPDMLKALPIPVGVLLLLHPFLREFATHSANTPIAYRVVPLVNRPAFWHWLIQLWPLLVLIGIALLVRSRDGLVRRWAIAWALVWLFAELVYVDEVFAGKFDRFNTSLKWMPWIYNGASLSLGALCLAHGSRHVRWVTAATLGLSLSYGAFLARHWVLTPKPSVGRLEGSAWLTVDPAHKRLVERLKVLPDGLVLQEPRKYAYVDVPSVAVFAGKPSFIGWTWPEKMWRGVDRADIPERFEDATRFYAGQMEDLVGWLLDHDIEYVVWLREQNRQAKAFGRLHEALSPAYAWVSTSGSGTDLPIGFWRRRQPAVSPDLRAAGRAQP